MGKNLLNFFQETPDQQKCKEQGTVLAKICRYPKLNKIYIGQKPKICPVQWYIIHLCISKIAN
jgi:hypothetical protein